MARNQWMGSMPVQAENPCLDTSEEIYDPYSDKLASLFTRMSGIENKPGAGVLLGLACGDALGRPVEFKEQQFIQREYGTVKEMLGYGTHGKPAGTVTDDTDLALCIARSLNECRAFNPEDIAARFLDWYNSGPFDIGITTSSAMWALGDGIPWDEAGKRAWDGNNAGNGSVMRCAPLALAYQDDRAALVEASKQSSIITHYDPRCVYGCVVLNLTLAGLIDRADHPLQTALDLVESEAPAELIEALGLIRLTEESTRIGPSDLSNGGYVIETLQTALYYGLNADSAEDAIVEAVNRGGDADTIGAVTGALAAARFGQAAMPDRWINVIDEADALEQLGQSLVTTEFEPPEGMAVAESRPDSEPDEGENDTHE